MGNVDNMSDDNIKRYIVLLCGFSGSISGGDEHALQLIRRLGNSGERVYVIAPKSSYQSHLPRGVEFVSLPKFPFEIFLLNNKPVLFLIYLWRILFSWFALRRLRISETDVLVSASHLFHDIFPLLGQRRVASEFVFAYHLIHKIRKANNFTAIISAVLEKISLSIVAGRGVNVITSSSVVQSQLQEALGTSHCTVSLTKNGIDAEIINSTPHFTRDVDVAYCGRLVERKGSLDLIEALRLMGDRNISVKIIGRGPLVNDARKLIGHVNLTNVLVLDNVDDYEKFRILKSTKVFVLPSYEEGWGIVIGEALACGATVIAYAVDEIRAIWGESVTWVPVGRVDILASEIRLAVNRYAENKQQEGYWLNSLNWDAVIQADLDCIRRCSGRVNVF